jgi:hypothetical protein
MACAIATILCYGFMMITSYVLGQKYYPVPYAKKKLIAYIVICILLFGIHQAFLLLDLNVWINRGVGIGLVGSFALLIVNVERKEFQKLPYIGKYFSPKIA